MNIFAPSAHLVSNFLNFPELNLKPDYEERCRFYPYDTPAFRTANCN